MTQFVEGQEVEVKAYKWSPLYQNSGRDVLTTWRKAKIMTISPPGLEPVSASVIFPDGSRGVFEAAHIRAVVK
jgi:hypothetical protein